MILSQTLQETLYPRKVLSEFGVMQATLFAAVAIFGLSQGFVWGYAGIMSFGQAAFLGIGAYTYAIAAINLGNTQMAALLAIAVPMLFAALLGYFMFYGRISDAYVGVITLTVSVILFELMNSTSGSQYHIGDAVLGGFNATNATSGHGTVFELHDPGEYLRS